MKHEPIFDAMIVYNKNKPANKFTLIDARIINLIQANQNLSTSNNHLADKCFATAATIQKSINKLHNHNLITKQVLFIDGKKQRILTCNQQNIEKFIKENNAWQTEKLT